MRLDSYLVQKLKVESRTKAQKYIKDGLVSVNGKGILKSSFIVMENDKIQLQEIKDYVSRSAFKLKYFLDEIGINIEGREALDIGSSTGGFSQVLLEYGSDKVVAVDVGRNQLHAKLKEDKRIVSVEETDIREFQHIPFPLVVSDVSFISLLKLIESIDRLASKDIILLFKPQFEVGKGIKRDKKGVVKDEKAIMRAMISFEDHCLLYGWKLVKKSPASITGKDGNLEYCYYYVK